MAAITMTSTNTPAPWAALLTAGRFAGHFLAALVGVTFLGRHAEH
ncbi:hypothetical protein AB0I60_23595 [Actinosynnema sp. NPDC050436]